MYLCIPLIKKPTLKGKNADELQEAVAPWLQQTQSNIFRFINEHTTHKAILTSTTFYYSKSNEQACRELLERKSKNQ